jgi:hypothetical protein
MHHLRAARGDCPLLPFSSFDQHLHLVQAMMLILNLLVLVQVAIFARSHAQKWQSLHPRSALSTASARSQSSSRSETSSRPQPTHAPFITAFAFAANTPIHLQMVNARNYSLWLGGPTVSYCPGIVQDYGDCPPGNYTAFAECVMVSLFPPSTSFTRTNEAQAIEVPGGQYLYSNPYDGSIGYTIPHSSLIPVGSMGCPFQHDAGRGNNYGILTPRDTNAAGFMACPELEHGWRIYLDIDNATVPTGNVSDCLSFGALTMSATNDSAAWEYL